MSNKLITYSLTLLQRYEARDEGLSDREEQLLSELDHLWLEMSEEERDESRQVARATKARYNLDKGGVQTHFTQLGEVRGQIETLRTRISALSSGVSMSGVFICDSRDDVSSVGNTIVRSGACVVVVGDSPNTATKTHAVVDRRRHFGWQHGVEAAYG